MSNTNSKFFFYNLVTQSPTELEVVSGTENAFFPVSNLKSHHTTDMFRTTTDDDAIVLIDCQTPSDVDSFLICGNSTTNLAVNAITIEGNATSDFSDPAFSISVSDFDFVNGFAHVFFSAQRYRYWRITFAPTSDYVEVSNIFLGTALQLTSNNIALGWEFQNRDLSQSTFSRYGQRYVDKITDQKTVKASIQLMDQAEFESIDEMFQYCGTNKPIWAVIDPSQTFSSDNRLSGYFFVAGDRPVFSNPFHGLFTTEFNLEEAK
jgi:hypothetical protein